MSDAITGGSSALSPSTLGGRRGRRTLKRVSAKTIRRTLRKMGMRPKGRVVIRGGEDMGAAGAEGVAGQEGGRRRRSRRSRRGTRRSLFGIKY